MADVSQFKCNIEALATAYTVFPYPDQMNKVQESIKAALEYLEKNGDGSLTQETIAKLDQIIPRAHRYILSAAFGDPEYLRLHIDNCLTTDASYNNVKWCVALMQKVRAGANPMEIPNLLEFASTLSAENQARFVTHGSNITSELEMKQDAVAAESAKP